MDAWSKASVNAKWSQISVAELVEKLAALNAAGHPHGLLHGMIVPALAALECHFPGVAARGDGPTSSQRGAGIVRISQALKFLEENERRKTWLST